jgi:hypothetical protein
MASFKEISEVRPAEKELDDGTRVQIKAIMDGIKCPKALVCYTSGFRTLCQAKDIGLESFVMCLINPDSSACKFSVDFGGAFFCKCPIRVLICKKLQK